MNRAITNWEVNTETAKNKKEAVAQLWKEALEAVIDNGGPEFDVWNHLYSGLDLAMMELDSLPEKARTVLTEFGEQIFSQRTNLTVAPNDDLARLSKLALDIPWIKFTADIAFAKEAMSRATEALDRYVELQPILTNYTLTDLAAQCLQKAGQMFIFSFDAGCVVFCSAVLEQTLRHELEQQNNRKGARHLLNLANEKKLLSKEAKQAANDLIDKRNEVIHQRFDAHKDEALKSMDHLCIVLQELRTR